MIQNSGIKFLRDNGKEMKGKLINQTTEEPWNCNMIVLRYDDFMKIVTIQIWDVSLKIL